jgi:hypothetical protein
MSPGAEIGGDGDVAGEADLDPMSEMVEMDQPPKLESAHRWGCCWRSTMIATTDAA